MSQTKLADHKHPRPLGTTLPLIATLLLVASGCAHVRPTLEVTPSGDLGSTDTQDIVNAAYASDRDRAHVPVFDDSTNPVDRSQYEVLGSVFVEELTPGAMSLRNALWYQQFESRGLFGYCVWQMPLKILTLSLWNIVPLAWPCIAGNPSSAADRLAYLLPYARRVTAEMGGDTAVLVGTESSEEANSWGMGLRRGSFMNFGAVTEVSIERNTGIKVLVLKHLEDAQRPPSKPSPASPPLHTSPAVPIKRTSTPSRR